VGIDLSKHPGLARRVAEASLPIRPEIARLCAAAERVLRPKRRRGPTPEGRVKSACVKYLEARGWTVHRLNVVDRPLGGGGWIKQGVKGDPDLLCLRRFEFCRSNEGYTDAIYVECKAGKNPVHPTQLARHEELRKKTGAQVLVVRDGVEDLIRQLDGAK
jgi:hypothetical protein